MDRTVRALRLLVLGAALAIPTSAAARDAQLTDGTDLRIGFSQADDRDAWRVEQTKDVESDCKDSMPHVEVFVTDGQGDGAKQDADVDDLIARGIDVLLLAPLNGDALTPAAQRALDAGIPVITLDRAVAIPVTQHIGADDKVIGRRAAQYVAETLLGAEGGTVLEIQGVQGASATTDRHDAFVAWLAASAPNVTIADSQAADYRRDDALAVMNGYLQANAPGTVDVVYAHNDEMALGARQALEQAGRQDEMAVVGIDGQNEAIQAIADGRLAATFTYENAAKEACESARKLLSGQEIEPTWVLEPNRIDPTNAVDWIGKGF